MRSKPKLKPRGRPFPKGHAGPGRPKGSRNKAGIEAREFARSIVDDAEYQARLRIRILAGTASDMEKLLWHYAKGKPPERVEMSGVNGEPIQERREIVLRFIEGQSDGASQTKTP